MVSTSWGAASNLLAGLVDTLIALGTYTQAPYVNLPDCSKTAWVQIDLGQARWLNSVTFWSYYDGRVQCSISVALSATCLFAGEQVTVFSCTSFSSCPTLTASGYTVAFSAQQARCVRWESGRNNYDVGMHFLEMRISAGQHTCGERETDLPLWASKLLVVRISPSHHHFVQTSLSSSLSPDVHTLFSPSFP